MKRLRFIAILFGAGALAQTEKQHDQIAHDLRTSLEILGPVVMAAPDEKKEEVAAILIHLAGIVEGGSFEDLKEVLAASMKVNLSRSKRNRE